MKHNFFSQIAGLLCLTALSLSCQKTDLKDSQGSGGLVEVNSAIGFSAQTAVRPFSGSFETVNHSVTPPPMLHVVGSGTGVATHMGNSTITLTAIVDLSVPPPNPLTGTQVITAANGDQLFSVSTGLSSPPNTTGDIIVRSNNTITGGTGRFLNASGSFESISTRNVHGTTATLSLEGTISY